MDAQTLDDVLYFQSESAFWYSEDRSASEDEHREHRDSFRLDYQKWAAEDSANARALLGIEGFEINYNFLPI